MFALLLIPTPLCPTARADGGGDGPVIDPEVQRVMQDRGEEEHPLVLVVSLCRQPLDLESLLPTPEQYNECTAKWRAWERLVACREHGEDVSDEDIEQARFEAEKFDRSLVEEQQTVARAYEEDYRDIVAESVGPLFEQLKARLGDKVRRPSLTTKMLSLRGTQADLDAALSVAGLERIALDMITEPLLENSVPNIRADWVHDGNGGVGPYDGSGVKVLVADEDFRAHDRLPEAAESDQMDFTDTCDIASCGGGHGSSVCGVIFCQSDNDGRVGVAPGAVPMWAKVAKITPGECCGEGDHESWENYCMPAFDWGTSGSPTSTGAKIINFSRGAEYDGEQEDENTLPSSLPSLNVDWLVYTRGASFVHACGNSGPSGGIGAPSGAYNGLSIGGYDDNDGTDRSENVIWETTSRGPTDTNQSYPVGRRKPDLCAPSVGITTTSSGSNFSTVDGTSFAAPHVAGTCALLKEARPSLTPRQIHAILVNSAEFASHRAPPYDEFS